MTKPILNFALALFSMFLMSTLAWAGSKHSGPIIDRPSAHLFESPWFLGGLAILVAIIAFRVLRSARG